VGSAARALVKDLTEPLLAELGFEAVVGAPIADPAYAFNKDRNQYHAAAILRRLAGSRPAELAGVIGVFDHDLFVPEGDFVFGEADRESHVGILSIARMRPEFYGHAPNNDLLRARGRVELAHLAGHLAGLSNCQDPRCLMFLSANVTDTDRKNTHLCHECRNELGRQARAR